MKQIRKKRQSALRKVLATLGLIVVVGGVGVGTYYAVAYINGQNTKIEQLTEMNKTNETMLEETKALLTTTQANLTKAEELLNETQTSIMENYLTQQREIEQIKKDVSEINTSDLLVEEYTDITFSDLVKEIGGDIANLAYIEVIPSESYEAKCNLTTINYNTNEITQVRDTATCWIFNNTSSVKINVSSVRPPIEGNEDFFYSLYFNCGDGMVVNIDVYRDPLGNIGYQIMNIWGIRTVNELEIRSAGNECIHFEKQTEDGVVELVFSNAKIVKIKN